MCFTPWIKVTGLKWCSNDSDITEINDNIYPLKFMTATRLLAENTPANFILSVYLNQYLDNKTVVILRWLEDDMLRCLFYNDNNPEYTYSGINLSNENTQGLCETMRSGEGIIKGYEGLCNYFIKGS